MANSISVSITSAKRSGGKKGKRKDSRPARARYWLKRTLEKRKIRNILKNKQKDSKGNLLTEFKAKELWQSVRFGRLKDGFIRRSTVS